MNRKKVMIDCDTGIDDAVALVLAWGLRDRLDILGVTTVAGNVGIENTTRNTLNVLKLIGAGEIPVAKGAEKPIEREPLKASGVHGVSGLRGYTFEQDSREALVEETAWDFMYRVLKESEEKVTLIATGPVTNLAILFMKYPEIKKQVDQILFMGTSWHDGNPTPLATFNVLVDPEAFRYLLNSGVDVCACPLETTRKAYITPEENEYIGTFGNRAGELVSKVLSSYGVENIQSDEVIDKKGEEEITAARIAKSAQNKKRVLHDPAVVAYAAFPEFFTVEKYYCDVECKGELTTGFTLIDKADYYGKTMEERNLYLAETVDRERFLEALYRAVRMCD
ncbi:nucleoside hydrolase [Clostridium sp. chh4-2]|uniref:nucleoside hydrolase n=1 Tax=Clostridium sp. chh4-2 TaxID=2067550 RepID=UPI000CCE9CD9|nr:nucleoside hydrolase [Clostridium sp. chh4-2]PNV60877.1 nucleoside hydrolase [Clostridium sp. chh4-2]